MIKRTVGTGLMKTEAPTAISYEWRTKYYPYLPDMLQPIDPPPEIAWNQAAKERWETAQRLQVILEKADLGALGLQSDLPFEPDWLLNVRLRNFSEDTAEWLAAHWIRAYRHLRALRNLIREHGVAEEIIDLSNDAAETLGRLQERLWWRTSPIPGTTSTANPDGLSAEKLGLERQQQRQALRSQTSRRDYVNAVREAIAQQWKARAQMLANERWQAHPHESATAVATWIRRDLEKWWAQEIAGWLTDNDMPKGIRLPSADVIRRSLKKPVQARSSPDNW